MLCKYRAGVDIGEISAATLALVDGGASNDTLTDTDSGLVAAGFAVGQRLQVITCANAANKVNVPILSVAVGSIGVPTGTWTAVETAGNTIRVLGRPSAVSFADLFHNAQLDIYSGSIPTTPDDAENGTLLCFLTGLQFGEVVWDATEKRAYVDLLATVTGTPLASGTAAWFRLRGGGAVTTGASTTMIRIDGTVGVSSGDMKLATVTFEVGRPLSISSAQFYFPYIKP
jgi:hypothetical protein